VKYSELSSKNRAGPQWLKFAAAGLLAVAIAGCGGGDDGATGPAGATGPVGATGPAGTPAVPTVQVAALSPAQWADAKFTGTITGVTIASPPVVNFKVTDAAGNPVVGLANTTKTATAKFASYPNVAFTIAKLVPGTNGDPSKWVSYNVTSVETTTAAVTASKPTTDNTGNLVDNGDGSYQYTFYRDITKVKDVVAGLTLTGNNVAADLGDLTYDPSLTHRVVLQLSGNARGTGTNTADGSNSGVTAAPLKNPVNAAYDFIPATGKAVVATDAQRNIVATAKCNECHDKLNALGFHGGSRNEIQICVTCHTDQRKYGNAEATTTATGYSGNTYKIGNKAVGDFPPFIHKLHGGSVLKKTGYNYANILFNEIGYPQDIANCTKCHDGSATSTSATTTQGDNWKNVPSILACGSCHDGINFATGAGTTMAGAATGHVGGAKANNAQCVLCHDAVTIPVYHAAQIATPHNATVQAGLKNFKYEIKSADATATNVKVVFKINMDGTPVTFLPAAAGMKNPLTGFTGGPGFLLAYAKTQDGVTTPADFNNLGRTNAQPISVNISDLLDTNKALTSGTVAGPDASGYYTATIVGAANIFPAGSVMRTVALQSYFTQISPAAGRHTLSVVKNVTGDTARRSVIDPNKCGNCHEVFEGHGGSRNIGLGSEGIVVCLACHNPGIVTSGRGIADATLAAYPFTAAENATLTSWDVVKTAVNAALGFPQVSNDFKDMIHGIHAGKDRTNPIRIARDRTPSAITLIDGKEIAFPGILNNCETCHKAGTYSNVPANALVSTHEADNGVFLNGVSRTPADAKAALAQPNASDIVTTPFTAACVSCHDTSTAKAHMTSNGGQILVKRSDPKVGESCAVCHSAGKEFDAAVVHK
jgi:OmcA/MtrC family decaheme c-type cytochrome